MASSFEKSVKGGTKIKLAAPKSKYVEHILVATHAGEAGVAEIFRALQNRLRDSTWTIVFKGLIIVHLMIREGEPDVTLRYLAANPRKLAISNFSDVQLQGRNIRNYTQFLLERARAYRDTKVDFVRSGEGRLKRLSVDKGLLRETESVQAQIDALLKCDLLADEPENEITLTAFRLLVTDLLALFYVMNEGVINILEHFFEMSKYDAERALAIYKVFSKQTNEVVVYLAIARQFEHATRLEVPKLKHAPTSLTGSLEEYTQDPDFEINRRQYLAQQDAKKGRGNAAASNRAANTNGSKPSTARPATEKRLPSPKPAQEAPPNQEAKGPAPDLIDFFESIEQNQQHMAQGISYVPAHYTRERQDYPYQVQDLQFNQQIQPGVQPGILGPGPANITQQQTGAPFDPQRNPSFNQPQPVQQSFTGAGFGGYTPQPQPSFNIPELSVPGGSQQQGIQQPIPPQDTNPFRKSMMPMNSNTASSQPFITTSLVTSPTGQQSTNPFAKALSTGASDSTQLGVFSTGPVSPAQMQPSFQFQQASTPQVRAFSTGTNPFTQATSMQGYQHGSSPASTGALTPQPTASTNPFRQSVLPSSQPGGGWGSGQGTMGGLEQLPTIPIFPRPGEQ